MNRVNAYSSATQNGLNTARGSRVHEDTMREDKYPSLTEIERAQREDVGVQPFGSAEAEELRRLRSDLEQSDRLANLHSVESCDRMLALAAAQERIKELEAVLRHNPPRDPGEADVWGVFDTWGRKWCPRRGTEEAMGRHAVQLNTKFSGAALGVYRYQSLPLPVPANTDMEQWKRLPLWRGRADEAEKVIEAARHECTRQATEDVARGRYDALMEAADYLRSIAANFGEPKQSVLQDAAEYVRELSSTKECTTLDLEGARVARRNSGYDE